MRPVGKFLSGLLLLMAVGRGVGSPPDAVLEPLDADSSRFAFRVSLPQLRLTQDPRLDTVRLDGFRNEDGAGLPALPTRTVLIAAPPGAAPRIEIDVERFSELPGIRPQAAPSRRYDVRPETEPARRVLDPVVRPGPAERVEVFKERIESPVAYGAGVYPPRVAHIARQGVLRDQRYVAVRLDPVRYDADRNTLLVAERFVVTVHFDGARGGASAIAAESPLESVYREAFLNYGQSRTFRAEREAPAVAASTGGTDDPSARHRIRVAQNGVVRLDESRMSGTGFLSENLSSWKLTSSGVEVPLHVHDANMNDLMDAGDFVQFYGQALDDEPKAVLNYDFTNPNDEDIFEARDFGDVRTYFLTVEAGARARMPLVESTPTLTRTPPAHFEDVAHAEEDQAWRPLRDADPWYWIPTLAPNTTASRSDDVALPGLFSGTEPATIRVQLRSTSEDSGLDPDHRTRVTVRNSSVQTLATDEQTYDGRIVFMHSLPWTFSGNPLTDPVTVDLEALTVSGANHSVILDWIEVSYRRSFDAIGGVLEFEWIDEDAEFIVDGLTSSSIEVYEITDIVGGTGVVDSRRLDPLTLQVGGTGPFNVRFRVDDTLTGAPRRFVVFDPSAVSVPSGADFEPDTVSNLKDGLNQAEMIIIAHPDVLDEAVNGPLDQLRSLRSSQGIDSIVARLPDVEDEFNDGHPGPTAIRNFLDFVMNGGWADPKPSYVLLIGDGSFDYKGGTSQGNFVPTWIMFLDRPELGYYASDNRMGAVVGGDPLTDLTFGRIPARTLLDANTMLQKIVDYEQMPPPDAWSRHGLFVSDRGKNFSQGEADAFEGTNQDAADTMVAPYTTRHLRYRTDFNETDANGLRQEIKDGINGADAFTGAGIVQFIGHGNFDLWSDDVFLCGNAAANACVTRGLGNDTDDFNNGLELPWMLAQNCLTGGFHGLTAESMGESWLRRPGGGAMGVFSPTGLSFNFIGDTVSGLIFDDLFGAPKIREVRTPIQSALTLLCGDESVEPCQNYVYLGDPASRLELVSVPPPSNVVTTSGDTTITLDWDGPDGHSFDVYRTENLNTAYEKANGSPVMSKQFVDSGLVNARTYYYYVVAVDGEGFESAWSNFNSDCDVDGPDCVKEQPLNLTPPASPTGLVVTDQETGGTLAVTWNPNGENDLDFYTVHWGVQSGVYTDAQETGRRTSTVLSGLVDGTTYFIAVTATNTSGAVSPFDPQEEATGVPSFVRGIRAPGFVSDLVVDKAPNGTDVALSWGAVTEDIFGKDATISTYEVFRGETPDFTPSSLNRVATVGTTSWDDPGALTAGPDYHYLVRAVNGDGDGGGLGNQLPDGIEDLTLIKAATPGNVILSWTPVGETFDGDPVAIAHYEIYASGAPFGRGDICDPIDDGCTGLTPIQTTTASSIEITPVAGDRYYSVLAVDARGNKSPF